MANYWLNCSAKQRFPKPLQGLYIGTYSALKSLVKKISASLIAGDFFKLLSPLAHPGSAHIAFAPRNTMARVTVEDCLNHVENRF